MEQATKRRRTGGHIPGALTSSKRKNQSLGRTRRKRERAQQTKSTNQTPEKSLS